MADLSLHICVDQLAWTVDRQSKGSVAVLPAVSQTRPCCGVVEGELQRLLTPQLGRATVGGRSHCQERSRDPRRDGPCLPAWLLFLSLKLRASGVTTVSGLDA